MKVFLHFTLGVLLVASATLTQASEIIETQVSSVTVSPERSANLEIAAKYRVGVFAFVDLEPITLSIKDQTQSKLSIQWTNEPSKVEFVFESAHLVLGGETLWAFDVHRLDYAQGERVSEKVTRRILVEPGKPVELRFEKWIKGQNREFRLKLSINP
jgi:hypothetical protein